MDELEIEIISRLSFSDEEGVEIGMAENIRFEANLPADWALNANNSLPERRLLVTSKENTR